jgi:MFS family permease
MNGYNGSLLDGLLQNEAFKEFFGGSNKGIWVGVVASIYQIGSIASIPLVGPALDTWGRTKGILIGVCIIIFGSILQGTSYYGGSLKRFMAGRFFSGFGANIIGTGAPIYVIELCHPAHRGVITALFNSFW